MVNFYCFKWGTKYSDDYVNRLYNSLKINVDVEFEFHCITDINDSLNPHINVIDIESVRQRFNQYPQGQIFTREKLCLFGPPFSNIKGTKIWVDLDILIYNNITFMTETQYKKPQFIWNHWRDDRAAIRNYSYMTTPINSSFVCWQDDIGYNIYDILCYEEEKAFYTYPSLDKYLFYRHHKYNRLNFHDKGIFWNYNIGCEYPNDLYPGVYRDDYKVCIFNTSHKKWGNPNDTYIELHETTDWAKTIWDSYE